MCGTAAGRCDDSPRRLLTKSQKATHSSSANEWTMLSFFTCITVAFCAWTMFAKPASFCVVFARSSTLRNSSKSTDAEPSWSTSRIIDATLSRGIGVPSFSIAAESSSTVILPEPSASNALVAASSIFLSYLTPSLWRQAPRRRTSMEPVPPSNMQKTASRPGLDRGVTGRGADPGRLSSSSPGFQPSGLSGSASSADASRPAWRSCVLISPRVNLPSLSQRKYLP